MKQITVLLVDDSDLVREEFRNILKLEDDLEVVGEAENGPQAVAMAGKLRPDVILMDITMPLLNGLEATREILKALPDAKVLVLSMHEEEVYLEETIKSGAVGYLVKYTSADILRLAIREIHKGNTFFSPSIPKHLQDRKK